MTSFGDYDRVMNWLLVERAGYQPNKFDYETEREKPVEYWIQQFDSYIQRLPVFGLDSLPGRQAALKLAATTVALCEALAASGSLPEPGHPSGEIKEWVNDGT